MYTKEKMRKHMLELEEDYSYVSSLRLYLSGQVLDHLCSIVSKREDFIVELFCHKTKLNKKEVKEWLEWYIFETGFSKKPGKASINHVDFVVDSFDVFWSLLEELKDGK